MEETEDLEKGWEGGFGKGGNFCKSGGFGKGGYGKAQKGFGKGKGPTTGCWSCGGAHFQANCPNAGGSFKTFEEYNEGSVQSLGTFSQILEKAFEDKWQTAETKKTKPKGKKDRKETDTRMQKKSFETGNSFGALQAEGEDTADV